MKDRLLLEIMGLSYQIFWENIIRTWVGFDVYDYE